MAKRVGVVREWTDGKRRRVAIELWHEGRRYMIYSDVDRWGRRVALTRETADALLDDIRAEIRQRRNIEAALAPFLGANAPENTIRVRWTRFLEQKERESRDGRITARHLRELRGIEKRGYLDSILDRSIYELDYGLLEDWLGWLSEAKPGLSPKTRRHALGAIMALANWLRKRREINDVPDAPEIKIADHSPVLIDEATQAAILDAIPENARGIFLALARMGLRPGEARGLDAPALRDGWLSIHRASKDRRAAGVVMGTKTGAMRNLPCDPELLAWIEKHVPAERRLRGGPMFVNPRGRSAEQRWAGSAMDRVWATACMRALRRKVPMYEATRHSFATQALARGAPFEVVQQFLGHRDSRTTRRYAKISDSTLLRIMGRTASKPLPGGPDTPLARSAGREDS